MISSHACLQVPEADTREVVIESFNKEILSVSLFWIPGAEGVEWVQFWPAPLECDGFVRIGRWHSGGALVRAAADLWYKLEMSDSPMTSARKRKCLLVLFLLSPRNVLATLGNTLACLLWKDKHDEAMKFYTNSSVASFVVTDWSLGTLWHYYYSLPILTKHLLHSCSIHTMPVIALMYAFNSSSSTRSGGTCL